MSNTVLCGHPLEVQECSACDGLGLPPAADKHGTWMQYPSNLPTEWCGQNGMLFDGDYGNKQGVYYCSRRMHGNAATSCAELPQLDGYQPWKAANICITANDDFGGTIVSYDSGGKKCCALPVAKKERQMPQQRGQFVPSGGVQARCAPCQTRFPGGFSKHAASGLRSGFGGQQRMAFAGVQPHCAVRSRQPAGHLRPAQCTQPGWYWSNGTCICGESGPC